VTAPLPGGARQAQAPGGGRSRRMQLRSASRDEPEINLIPFIDVLLVILIFLMLSTTYSKFTEMQLSLPVADADAQRDYPKEVIVAVSSDGTYAVNRSVIEGRSVEAVTAALLQGAKAGKDTVVIISADASARHQSVVTVMEAARRAGLTQITFATQSSARAGTK
jgi:biopolymer transport protein ExbD